MRQQQREQKWPARKVQMWPIVKFKTYEHNPRTHSDDQVDLLARSMKDDGVTSPILIDEKGVIIAGHGRFLAAQKNGFDRYPVVIARGWSENKKRAVRIKDNQLSLLAGWDNELLKMEMGELRLGGFDDMGLLGFSENQMLRLGDGDQDASPQLLGLSYAVIVRCQNEIEQRDLLERFEREGMKCEALIS